MTKLSSSPKKTATDAALDIRTALDASMRAHAAYRERLAAKDAVGARAALVMASDYRQQAHQRDPKHTHAAWEGSATTHPHAALTDFYRGELAK